MQMVRLRISGALVFLLLACSDSKHKPSSERVSPIDNTSNYRVGSDTLLNNWLKDSLGCLHTRNHATGLALSKKYALTGKSVDEIITVLGAPNKIIAEGKTKVLRYYFNTCCANGKLINECDYSWMDFSFADFSISKCIVTGGDM